MENFTTTDSAEAMQRMFAPMLAMNESTSHHLERFWKNQDNILRSMQELAQDWFERRHKATETALAAVSNVTQSKQPADMLQEYQTWLMSSFDRMIADGAACQKHLMNVTEAVVAQLPLDAGSKAVVASTPVTQNKTPRRAEAA